MPGAEVMRRVSPRGGPPTPPCRVLRPSPLLGRLPAGGRIGAAAAPRRAPGALGINEGGGAGRGNGANRFVVVRMGLGARRCPREGPAAWPRVSGDSGPFSSRSFQALRLAVYLLLFTKGREMNPWGWQEEKCVQKRGRLWRGAGLGARAEGAACVFQKHMARSEGGADGSGGAAYYGPGLWKSRASSG